MLRHARYMGEIEIKNDLLNKIKTEYPGFNLKNLYEYKFPNGLAKLQMEMDDFYVPQRR